MKCKGSVLFPLMLVVFSLCSRAQQWAPILGPYKAIDWSRSGVGAIPFGLQSGSTILASACGNGSTDCTSTIQAALASCSGTKEAEGFVSLGTGRFLIDGNLSVPSYCYLKGQGADQTILNAMGTGHGNVINTGKGGPPYATPTISITGGATAGSTSIVVRSALGISVGKLLAIGEMNDPNYTSSGSEGVCTWCDAGWSRSGIYARGQVVSVTGVNGNTLTISPGLYGTYANSPLVAPFSPTVDAGVENLQVFANNTGYNANFGMAGCAYCWIKGVESNYTDGDHVDVYWGYHDEVRDSYFSNSYLHTPGQHDSDVVLAEKTSATLVENNIIERTHVAIMLEWGAAGNVVAYNYTMGEYDANATSVVMGGIDYHGAHPQFNLLEGNVTTQISQDSIWGSSSTTTAFRNWVVGTNHVCTPTAGSRVTVSCSRGIYGFQSARAMQYSYLATSNNFVGNIIGSVQQQSLMKQYSPVGPLSQVDSVEYPSVRQYDNTAYGWSFGYGEASDSGMGTGCSGPTGPCHLAGTSATDFFHGNYSNITSMTTWANGVTQTLPASFYLFGKPSWWRSMPFPATGPDVTGGTGPGGHSYGNPAQACYINVMGGSDGGPGSPLTFNASACYGPPPPNGLTGTVH